MSVQKVHIVPIGSLGTDRAWLERGEGLPLERDECMARGRWVHSSMHYVIIEHSDGLICWDTGAPKDWEERWASSGLETANPYEYVEDGQYFADRLAELNFAPADFSHVVLSHLHCDHAGNLAAFKGTGAQLIVHEKELASALGFEGPFLGPYVKSSYEGFDFTTISGDTEILPGVRALETPGHTAGNMTLRVDTRNAGVLFFASDAIYTAENYYPRKQMPRIVWDEDMWRASADKIRVMAEEQDGLVVFGHDYSQLARLRVAPDSYYD